MYDTGQILVYRELSLTIMDNNQKATQTDNTAQSILAELSKLQAELGETDKMRGTNKTEVKKIEERLRSLGEEVMKKVCVWRRE